MDSIIRKKTTKYYLDTIIFKINKHINSHNMTRKKIQKLSQCHK